VVYVYILYLMFAMYNGVYCLVKKQLFIVKLVICEEIQLVPSIHEGGVCDTRCAMPLQVREQVIHD
jgi:hypothetical protein